MRGTLVCGVDDNDDGRAALDLGVELSDRLGLRLAPTRATALPLSPARGPAARA